MRYGRCQRLGCRRPRVLHRAPPGNGDPLAIESARYRATNETVLLIDEVLLIVRVALQKILRTDVGIQSEFREFNHVGTLQATSDRSLLLDLGVQWSSGIT